jgi:UPF0755 protein
VMFGRKTDPALPPAADASARPGLFGIGPKPSGAAVQPVPAPPPPPRIRPPRRRWGAILAGWLAIMLGLAAIGLVGLSVVQRRVVARGPLSADKVVVIPRYSGTADIAELLTREGVIDKPFLFEAYALLQRQRGSLKAGEFLFRAGSSIDETIDTLVQGKAMLHTVTIPEGLTSEQILARLNESDVLVGDISEVPQEGTLLPDTYKFERGTTRQQIIATMQAAHRQAVNQIWARRAPDLPIKTPQELVILASIVEKETGRADERTRVASVFINRLTKRMRLQSDPTIVYGLVGGKGTLGRGILRSEIDRATPYNTYAIEGLPPGPIANPGRAALEAVANPSRTKDLYFVADGTGGHVFAETYEQHARNVLRWRQVEKVRANSDEAVDRADPPLAGDPGPGAGPTGPMGTSALTAGRGAGRAGGVDASEGTPRDPLLNKTYDLNSPKAVPVLRSPP